MLTTIESTCKLILGNYLCQSISSLLDQVVP